MSTQYKKAATSWARVGCHLDQKQFASTHKNNYHPGDIIVYSSCAAFSVMTA
jgi:hypothetical protein